MRKLLLFLFSHRTLAVLRWDLHFLWLRLSNWAGGQRRRAIRRLANRKPPVLLNIGAGPLGRDDAHWVNVDGFPERNVDFLVDLQRRLPFPDSSFDGVFTEHVLEHFTQEEGQAVAAEAARVLRNGGVFRVIVPDGEFVVRSYLEDPDGLVRYRGAEGDTAMEAVNAFFRQRYEHQFIYDWPTLRRMLERAGFVDVVRTSFGRSVADLGLEIDDPKYREESLYVEARKGAAAATFAGGPTV